MTFALRDYQTDIIQRVRVREIAEGIRHHYSSPAGAHHNLAIWLQREKRVRVDRDGRALKFYPASVETPDGASHALA